MRTLVHPSFVAEQQFQTETNDLNDQEPDDGAANSAGENMGENSVAKNVMKAINGRRSTKCEEHRPKYIVEDMTLNPRNDAKCHVHFEQRQADEHYHRQRERRSACRKYTRDEIILQQILCKGLCRLQTVRFERTAFATN